MQSPRSIFSYFVRLSFGLLLLVALLTGLSALLGHTTPRRVVAFVTLVDRIPYLHLLDTSTHIVHRISDNPVYSCCPRWSPDGTAVAYDGNNNHTQLVDVYSGETRPLTPNNWAGWVMNWRENGQKIVIRSLAATNGSLYQVDPDGQHFVELVEGKRDRIYLPQLSPDGRFAFFVQQHPVTIEWFIYRLNLEDGTSRLYIRENSRGTEALAFSPDGKRLVYAKGDHHFALLMTTQGSVLRRLKPAEVVVEVVWSPDSRSILFLAQAPGGIQDVYITDWNGQNPRYLGLKNQFATMSDFSWSPDGTQILFAGEKTRGKSDLYLMNADGQHIQRLTLNPELNMFPTWQPGT